MERSTPTAERVLRLLGLAARGGGIITGTERVRDAVRREQVPLVLVAADAAENAREKLLPLLLARKITHRVVFTRTELGAAVGRSPLSAIGVLESSLARRVRELLDGSGVQE